MSQSKRQNYHIISLIGKGAYGEVYKARKKQTGQFVAIKTIKKKGKQEKDIKVMRQQITILKKLKHPNIIVLLDSFETSTEFIIVTELGQGQLFNIIEDDQYLQEPEIRKVAQQLIRALHYLHSNRITHRDLKPQNVLMTSQGNIKLCDFGFARHMSYKTEVLTSLKGTPLYMAPEVVQEQPYTHIADLWSLGVILYELSTGTPPFSAANLITLIDHISKDPVRYPESIQGDFKNLLKGLLIKDPKNRLGWPDLLNHPFIRETQQQKLQRKMKVDKLSNWIEQNHCAQEDENSSTLANTKSLNHTTFQERGRDISPQKGLSSTIPNPSGCFDSDWNEYVRIVSEQKGASKLRVDPVFLDKLLTLLSGNIGQLLRNKEKKNLMHCGLKVLTQVLLKSKSPENKNLDISKKLSIPNYLLSIMKSMIKLENGKNYLQIISDITKIIGLLAKITFNKTIGIEMVYIRSFLPLLPALLGCACSGQDIHHQTLTINLLRTIGIFANNASVHHLRSFSFYKDIVEIKFIPEFLIIFKTFSNHINVLKLFVQVLSAFMHPVYGEIQNFPWKRPNMNGVLEYKECYTMLECVRQSIINGLLEIDWIAYFEKIVQLDDESSILPKISVQRVIFQSMRQSKEFAQSFLQRPNMILKYVFTTLSNPDPVIYSTTCMIVGYIIKYLRETKKQVDLIEHEYLSEQILENVLMKINEYGYEKNRSLLGIFGSLTIVQELVIKNQSFFQKISSFLLTDKILKILSHFLAQSEKSKLEEMRKLQGSNYGIHSMGIYDPLFLSLHRILVKLSKQKKEAIPAIMKVIASSSIQARISDIIIKLSSKTDLSPKGMIALLMTIYDLCRQRISNEMMQPNFIKNLVTLLNQSQIEALAEWPPNHGGGVQCLQILFGNLMNLFLIYLQEAERENEILRAFYQNNLVGLVIEFCRYLNSQSISSVVTFMVHLTSFNNEKCPFVKQFIDSSGMALFVRFNLLKSEQYSISSILEACNLLSQIARFSKQTYEQIDSIEPFEDIKVLIKHNDFQIKSRILNLLGNLCRHSSYFYQKIQDNDLIKDIIYQCGSEDKLTKKFACVALGNAGFHDSLLYPSLRMSIPTLVALLKDTDQKTRSNAAAALGNLARNSDMLDQDFVSTGANYQLINMINNDKSVAAKKVSIMAIINLLNLPESSKILSSLNIKTILGKFVPPVYNSDPGLIKTAQKALDKCK